MKHVRLILLAALAAATLVSLPGCIVRVPRHAVIAPPPCPGGVWVEGHRNRHGRHVRGHWRCPGVVHVHH